MSLKRLSMHMTYLMTWLLTLIKYHFRFFSPASTQWIKPTKNLYQSAIVLTLAKLLVYLQSPFQINLCRCKFFIWVKRLVAIQSNEINERYSYIFHKESSREIWSTLKNLVYIFIADTFKGQWTEPLKKLILDNHEKWYLCQTISLPLSEHLT